MAGTIRGFSVTKPSDDTATLKVTYDVLTNTTVTLYVYLLVGQGTSPADWVEVGTATVTRVTADATGLVDSATFDLDSVGTGTFDTMVVISSENSLQSALGNYYDHAIKEDELIVTVPGEFAMDANTVALYHCNEGVGDNLFDETRQHNAVLAVMSGNMWTTDSKFGSSALHFSVNDWAICTHALDLNLQGDFTVEMWIKPNSVSGYQTLIAKSSNTTGWRMRIANGNLNCWLDNYTGYTSQGTLAAGQWNHVAATYNSSDKTLSLFINGEFDTSFSDINSPTGTNSHMTFGMASGGEYYIGSIDEIRISNTERYVGLPPPPPPQKAYISVTSTPSDADVYLDMVLIGSTPIILYEVGTGNHDILLTKNGYYDWRMSFNINLGETIPISTVLTQLPTPTKHIWGHVTDTFASPIAQAIVRCENNGVMTITDTNGYYDLNPQISGTGLKITASDPLDRYVPASSSVDYDGYNPIRQNFSLPYLPPDTDTMSPPHNIVVGRYQPPGVPFGSTQDELMSHPVIGTRFVDPDMYSPSHEIYVCRVNFDNLTYQIGETMQIIYMVYRWGSVIYSDMGEQTWTEPTDINTIALIMGNGHNELSTPGVYRYEFIFGTGDSQGTGKLVVYFYSYGWTPNW